MLGKTSIFLLSFVLLSPSFASAAEKKFECGGLFDSLRNCTPFKCRFHDIDFPDFISDYEVKGKDSKGKCRYVETFSYNPATEPPKEYMECLFDDKMRNSYANIMKNMMIDNILDRDQDFESFKDALKNGECVLKKFDKKKEEKPGKDKA